MQLHRNIDEFLIPCGFSSTGTKPIGNIMIYVQKLKQLALTWHGNRPGKQADLKCVWKFYLRIASCCKFLSKLCSIIPRPSRTGWNPPHCRQKSCPFHVNLVSEMQNRRRSSFCRDEVSLRPSRKEPLPIFCSFGLSCHSQIWYFSDQRVSLLSCVDQSIQFVLPSALHLLALS